MQRFAPEARGHGVPEVMYAINKRGGRIPAKVAPIKALASAITIGSGGSVGREGPIVQIGSAFGSTVARWAKLNESQVRLLVACGAAGGIAATFNAPIAGVFFALELLLANFVARTFAAVVLASVTASDHRPRRAWATSRSSACPSSPCTRCGEYALYAVLGLLAAVVATGFTKILYWFEDAADRSGRAPNGLRPGVGGLLLGLLLLAHSADVRRGLSRAGERGHGQVPHRLPLAAAGGQDRRHLPHHRDRRLGRRVRAVAVPGRRAGRRHSVRPPTHASPASASIPAPTPS